MVATQSIPMPRAATRDDAAVPAYAPRRPLSHASVADTLGVFFEVFLPTIAKGVIMRRPGAVSLAERLELDRRAVRCLQRLRARHGTAPLMLRLPLRSQAVLLNPADVHRVLQNSPQPFSTASSEKRAALAHFEPRGALISTGADRVVRRRFNEEALGHEQPVHPLAQRFVPVVEQEAAQLRAVLDRRGTIGWEDFAPAWFRIVRRVIFGDGASEDHQLSALMAQLRRDANWAFLMPRRRAAAERLQELIRAHLARAEAGSLAQVIAQMRPPAQAEPEQQIPQWLFAFDPAGMTAFRTLALLAAHPDADARAREEARGTERQRLDYLRACALEALRLWPTTPLVLRQTREDTDWDGAVMPAGTGILIYAPFFHRDNETQPYADRFSPQLWLHERSTADWPLIPFSEGPAVCPGRHLVLMLVSAMVAALIEPRPLALVPHSRLEAGRPLPGTLNHYTLRFRSAGA